ncbi:hypothetical protein [Spirosoma sordidisoli]|uniref:Uncharacterized protein n=1 Tax=Spirosoma sordidisoli TaxID=2502893 RepID=A0A4Q2UL43_9BACT|nr:hypothetical protein [Spirosoma sordidisoli]RYC67559.1 hypothetical protein EQG79_22890 [Spirosoma sordidisoli]
MRAREVNKVEPILRGLIHYSIINSINFIVDKCMKLGKEPQEPDFVAALTLKFTPALFNILKAAFPKYRFSVTGIFCHQKPLAEIGLTKSPEIGDLLIIYIYTDKSGVKKLNSVLLQAKISNKPTVTVSTGDEHQLKLYTEWPLFTYKRAGILTGHKRDILPKTINDGAQYLLIDDHPLYGLSGMTGTFPMGCATPSKTLDINNDLTEEIIDFLKFKSGRAFEENPTSTQDDWTKMMWDFLEVTRNKAIKRKNAGISDLPRQVPMDYDGYCFFETETDSILRDLHNQLGGGDSILNYDNYFDEDNFSPSLILIESNEQNEE